MFTLMAMHHSEPNDTAQMLQRWIQAGEGQAGAGGQLWAQQKATKVMGMLSTDQAT